MESLNFDLTIPSAGLDLYIKVGDGTLALALEITSGQNISVLTYNWERCTSGMGTSSTKKIIANGQIRDMNTAMQSFGAEGAITPKAVGAVNGKQLLDFDLTYKPCDYIKVPISNSSGGEVTTKCSVVLR